MPRITLPATLDQIERATDFLNGILERVGCPLRTQTQLDIALDELMSNVARYAYAPGNGEITISVRVLNDPRRVVLTLTDGGVPYDPLQKADPDVTLGAEERQIGGLGIFIVKKTMDKMTYAYKNKKNIVKITKNL